MKSVVCDGQVQKLFVCFRPNTPSLTQRSTDSPATKRHTVMHESSSSPQNSPRPKRAASTGSLNLQLSTNTPDSVIHSGAVMSIFHLLPAITSTDDKLTKALKVFTGGLLKNLLRKEHNQQVMCDAGFPHELLSHGNIALADESHPLHPSLQYMFERLASQSLTPRDLRYSLVAIDFKQISFKSSIYPFS